MQGIPEATVKLLEKKTEALSVNSSTPLKEVAEAVYQTTEVFSYGMTRAIKSLNAFPWPHEVEQLGEICCGTKALYRFLVAEHLRSKFQLPYQTVFLLDPNHASIALINSSEQFVLDGSVRTPEERDSSKPQLDVVDVVSLIQQLKSKDPLELLKANQTILRYNHKEKSVDLSVNLSEDSLVFNTALYDTPGLTTGSWIKLKASGIQRIDY